MKKYRCLSESYKTIVFIGFGACATGMLMFLVVPEILQAFDESKLSRQIFVGTGILYLVVLLLLAMLYGSLTSSRRDHDDTFRTLETAKLFIEKVGQAEIDRVMTGLAEELSSAQKQVGDNDRALIMEGPEGSQETPQASRRIKDKLARLKKEYVNTRDLVRDSFCLAKEYPMEYLTAGRDKVGDKLEIPPEPEEKDPVKNNDVGGRPA